MLQNHSARLLFWLCFHIHEKDNKLQQARFRKKKDFNSETVSY